LNINSIQDAVCVAEKKKKRPACNPVPVGRQKFSIDCLASIVSVFRRRE